MEQADLVLERGDMAMVFGVVGIRVYDFKGSTFYFYTSMRISTVYFS